MRELVAKLLALLLAFFGEKWIVNLLSVLLHIVMALRVTDKMANWRHGVVLECILQNERLITVRRVHYTHPRFGRFILVVIEFVVIVMDK